MKVQFNSLMANVASRKQADVPPRQQNRFENHLGW
jgi:hypothetical protein